MMRIDPSLQRNFPNLAGWITNEIPQCRHSPKIWHAFLRFSQLSVATAESALSNKEEPAPPPTIDIAISRDYAFYYDPTKSKKGWRNRDKIFLSRKWCRGFNKLTPDERYGRYGTRYSLILTATILHEMVHWGDLKDGVNQPDRDVYDQVHQRWKKNADVGYQFEVEAFYGIYSEEYL